MSEHLPTLASGAQPPALVACSNCGAPVVGHYCPACGQDTDARVHSLGHFLSEATEVLTHADSRVWRTLLPLVWRPSFLTSEYFAGRRARYLLPFRLYVVTGVLFLVVASLFGGELGGEAKPAIALAPPTAGPLAQQNARQAQQQAEASAEERRQALKTLEQVAQAVPEARLALEKANAARDSSAQTNEGGLLFRCAGHEGTTLVTNPGLRQRLEQACSRIVADNGHALGEAVTHNIGRAMFVFLPALAGIMKLLYWRPRRYYLEHLVLMLHNHAFVYLVLAADILATHWLSSGGLSGLIGAAMLLYVVRYLYRSMKLYYGQGGLLTFVKFSVLAFAYVCSATVMLFLTTVVSAMTL